MASETNVIRRDFECGCFIITGGVYVDVYDCPDHPAWWDEGAASVPGRDADLEVPPDA